MPLQNRIGRRLAVLAATAVLAGGCDRLEQALERTEPTLPDAGQIETAYAEHPRVFETELRGNLLELRVRQDPTQLRRGGSLWAKVGPYIYLFSPATRDLMRQHEGLAAVRVVTFAGGGAEVARAMLRRDALSDILWRRSLNLLGRALQEGTEQPRRLEELVSWGEEHTEYGYAAEWVPR